MRARNHGERERDTRKKRDSWLIRTFPPFFPHRGVEHIPQLRDLAENNMRKSKEGCAFLDTGRVRFRVGDGRKGWVEPAPVDGEGSSGNGGGWDVIHVGAAAVTMHTDLVAQLRSPGRMFIPVDDEDGGGAQSVWVVDKDREGKVERKRLFGVKYVPLTDAPGT